MKKTFWLGVVAVVLGTVSAHATPSVEFKDQALAEKQAAREIQIKRLHADQDGKLQKRGSADLSFLFSNDDDASCIAACVTECRGGTGSSACWGQCTKEGYSSSACANRCGVDTEDGSRLCWDKCTAELYGSSTCAERCRVTTPDGSRACWNKCLSEGYSSSTCSSRCGTDTSAGSAACWNKCTSEGYSSSACATRCGTR